MKPSDQRPPGTVQPKGAQPAPGGRATIQPPPLRWPGGAAGPGSAQPRMAGAAAPPAGRAVLPVLQDQRRNRPRSGPPAPAAVQRATHYLHSGTSQKFYPTHNLNARCGRAGPAYTVTNENGDSGCLRYSNVGNDLVIEHVEAAGGAAKGTGALLVYIAAKNALATGGAQCYIAAGARDQRATQFWTQMGFNMATVQTSGLPVPLTTVRDNARTRVNNDGWLQPGPQQNSKCFLSTACCAARGLPEDCAELAALRRFRDDVLAGTAEGDALLREYEEIAPRIVQAIDRRADAVEIYDRIYAELTLALEDIREQRYGLAQERYRRTVVELARELHAVTAT
jgi:hypothetical protein